jgi:hypothetical protein
MELCYDQRPRSSKEVVMVRAGVVEVNEPELALHKELRKYWKVEEVQTEGAGIGCSFHFVVLVLRKLLQAHVARAVGMVAEVDHRRKSTEVSRTILAVNYQYRSFPPHQSD